MSPRTSRRRAITALSVWVLLATTARAAALEANEPALADRQWGMQLIGAPTAWARGVTGTDVTIAVIDTGIDLGHEDLAGKLVPGTDIVDPSTPPQDDNGHGTHVAGIAAAVTGNGRGVTGVAPDARLMPVKVLDQDGVGNGSDIDEGIRWAVDHGADVINVSVEGVLDPLFGPSFAEALRYAWSKGVVPVVAAGNKYVLSGDFAAVPAIVVSATTRSDGRASYSSGVGSAQWPMSAPGGDGGEADLVFSTWWEDGASNLYAYSAGTSMASPHVAGAAALLRGAGFSPQATVDRLLATAKDLGATGRDGTFGAGRLDVAKATEGLGSAPATTSAPPTTSAPSPATTARAAGGATSTPTLRRAPSAGATSTSAATAGTVAAASPDASTTSMGGLSPAPTTVELEVATGRGQGRDRAGGDDVPPWLPFVAGLGVLGVAGWAMAQRIRVARREQ